MNASSRTTDRNHHRTGVTLVVLACALWGSAQQGTIDQVLLQVDTNNKRLAAEARTLEALGLREGTGLSLPDPTVDYDWMSAAPAVFGQQHDLTIAQAFEFPTAYGARRRSADIRISQHELEVLATRREVLSDAQRTCIALVHANKRALLLAERHDAAVRFRDGTKSRFDREAATILDLNKAELLEAGIAADLHIAGMERLALLQHLTELNGGVPLTFADTAYPPMPEPPPFEQYEQELEAADPMLRILERETEHSEEQTRMYKATGLPQFELGYRYQGILGATYNGVHGGMVVPLWSNRNKVKQQQAWTEASVLRTEEHRTKHYFEARHIYDRATELRQIAAELQARMAAASNAQMLERSFDAGQISALSYQMELLLLQEGQDRALELQWQSMDALAEMYRHRL